VDFALILASISFLLAVGWGPLLIRLLRHYRIGKRIRIDGPSGHQIKLGTPTMGGLMIVVPVLLITLGLNIYNLVQGTLVGRSILVPLGVMVVYALIGAVDDLAGVRGVRRGEGLTARQKIVIEIVLTFLIALVLHFGLELRSVAIPGVKEKIDIGLFYIPVAMFVIIGASNAVNFTDGLDGLAGIIAASAFAAYGVSPFCRGRFIWALLLYCRGGKFRLSVVQCPPSPVVYGGYGEFGSGRHLGDRRADDRSVAPAAGGGAGAGGGSALGDHPGTLL
jgi:phospho-N-acetylmuramoyl-pentapeptide-transferase